MVIKCLDESGEVALKSSATANLSAWEALGMFEAQSDQLRHALSQMFVDDGETEEEEEE